MGTKGLALDDHAVIEQDMQGIEQRQFRAAARPPAVKAPPTLPSSGPG